MSNLRLLRGGGDGGGRGEGLRGRAAAADLQLLGLRPQVPAPRRRARVRSLVAIKYPETIAKNYEKNTKNYEILVDFP